MSGEGVCDDKLQFLYDTGYSDGYRIGLYVGIVIGSVSSILGALVFCSRK